MVSLFTDIVLFLIFNRFLIASSCDSGKYGATCSLTCNVNCAGQGNPCKQSDGSCDLGCDPGFRSKLCDKVECDEGWFGSACQYLCHCARNAPCNMTSGACDEDCDPDWFGPACQYMSIKYEPEQHDMAWLVDNNKSTCNDGTHKDVAVQLVTPYPLTWVRVVTSDRVTPHDIELKYTSPKKGPGRHVCSLYNKASVYKTTLDISCWTNTKVKSLLLTGLGAASLCSLYISGGRNLALKQSTSQTSMQHTAKYAVDGNDGTRFDSGISYQTSETTCSKTSKSHAEYWTLTPSSALHMLAIFLYNRPDCCQHDLDGFTLVTLDKRYFRIYSYREKDGLGQKVYTLIPEPKITRIIGEISIKKSKNSPALRLCEVMVFGELACPIGKFGLECSRHCNCLTFADCFKTTGGCPSGCALGYTGEDCWTVLTCPSNTFGRDCERHCNCKSQENCNVGTGACTSGCAHGYAGEDCWTQCSARRFGPDCKLYCNCANETDCLVSTGVCPSGCVYGYTGENCSTECPPRKFGPDCEFNCTCLNHDDCLSVTGDCLSGCLPGFTGELCSTECPPHKFGPYCELHCACLNHNDCLTGTGDCLSGCLPGYIRKNCSKELVCPSGKFGLKCDRECNCLDQEECIVTTGACPSGCVSGYTGMDCWTRCPNKTWGLGCLSPCSPFCKDGLCDHVTGVCLACPPKLPLPYCKRKFTPPSSKQEAIFYILPAAVAILFTFFLVFFLRLKETSRRIEGPEGEYHQHQ